MHHAEPTRSAGAPAYYRVQLKLWSGILGNYLVRFAGRFAHVP
jgi:hypothetical protein